MSRWTVATGLGDPLDKTGADEVDVVLVGAGIMSSTLGAILKELQPDLRIEMLEVASERSGLGSASSEVHS
jgi:L-2-hydroxyglutarate oxidase LhgO